MTAIAITITLSNGELSNHWLMKHSRIAIRDDCAVTIHDDNLKQRIIESLVGETVADGNPRLLRDSVSAPGVGGYPFSFSEKDKPIRRRQDQDFKAPRSIYFLLEDIRRAGKV
jgi:hypothetical protein